MVFQCFEAVDFSFDSLCTLTIESLSRTFFARFIGGGNKEIHTKLNCVSDESGKRGRIIREARIPWICSEKNLKRVPVSFAIVENCFRREP